MGSTIEPISVRRRAFLEIGYGLITAGLVVLLFIAYQLWGTSIVEAKSQHRLRRQFEALVTRAPTVTAPSSTRAATQATPIPAPSTGEAVAHLVIPKIGVDKFVVTGVDSAELAKGLVTTPRHLGQQLPDAILIDPDRFVWRSRAQWLAEAPTIFTSRSACRRPTTGPPPGHPMSTEPDPRARTIAVRPNGAPHPVN